VQRLVCCEEVHEAQLQVDGWLEKDREVEKEEPTDDDVHAPQLQLDGCLEKDRDVDALRIVDDVHEGHVQEAEWVVVVIAVHAPQLQLDG
jgi:hypothetical protein